MTALAVTVLAASLVGSLHCAGMCGGFVAFYSGTMGAGSGRRRWVAHAAYSGGRLVAYAVLGALAGALGGALDLAGSLAGIQRVAAAAAGVLIVGWGLLVLMQALGARVTGLEPPAFLGALVARAMRTVAARPPWARASILGLVSGALPCGWLHAFVITAAGTGSALAGAAVMVVFWAGTLPMLVSLGAGLQALARPVRRHLPVACALAMIVVGVLTVAGRVRLIGEPGHGPGVPSSNLATESPGTPMRSPHARP